MGVWPKAAKQPKHVRTSRSRLQCLGGYGRTRLVAKNPCWNSEPSGSPIGTTPGMYYRILLLENVTVPMPLLTPPDLESLIEVLTRKLIGPWGQPPPPASVSRVTPTDVSACMNEVTFVIEGHNLWRDPEVYWEGVRAENVTLLPGMRGIAAAFQIKKLFDAEHETFSGNSFVRTYSHYYLTP